MRSVQSRMNAKALSLSRVLSSYETHSLVSTSIPTHVQASPHPCAFCSKVTFFFFAPTKDQISSHRRRSSEECPPQCEKSWGGREKNHVLDEVYAVLSRIPPAVKRNGSAAPVSIPSLARGTTSTPDPSLHLPPQTHESAQSRSLNRLRPRRSAQLRPVGSRPGTVVVPPQLSRFGRPFVANRNRATQ